MRASSGCLTPDAYPVDTFSNPSSRISRPSVAIDARQTSLLRIRAHGREPGAPNSPSICMPPVFLLTASF